MPRGMTFGMGCLAQLSSSLAVCVAVFVCLCVLVTCGSTSVRHFQLQLPAWPLRGTSLSTAASAIASSPAPATAAIPVRAMSGVSFGLRHLFLLSLVSCLLMLMPLPLPLPLPLPRSASKSGCMPLPLHACAWGIVFSAAACQPRNASIRQNCNF